MMDGTDDLKKSTKIILKSEDLEDIDIEASVSKDAEGNENILTIEGSNIAFAINDVREVEQYKFSNKGKD